MSQLREQSGRNDLRRPSPGQVVSLERIPDMTSLKPGDLVTARPPGHLAYQAQIDEVAPQLGVVWIRDVSLGGRRAVGPDELRIALA